MAGPYQLGNAVRLSITFKSYTGVAINPDTGTERLSLYKGANTDELLFTVLAAGITAAGTGGRQWDWVPTATGTYTYEWYGLIGGEPSVVRRSVEIVEV